MKQIKEDIKSGNFHPMYLLYGEEDYLVRNYKEQLVHSITGGDEMNFSTYQGDGIDFNELMDTANTLPFFAEYRLILLEDTKLFKKANELSELLNDVPDSTVFVFVEKEVDKRNKLYKFVNKTGVVAQMDAMSESDTKAFMVHKLSKADRKIRESTANYLLEQVDNSLTNLDNELEKLIAYTEGREEVTVQDIDSVCCVVVTGQIFKLCDAVASGNLKEVMNYYHDLLALKESPMHILYLLVRHFNILLQMIVLSKQYGKKELASKIGINPYFVGKYQAQCKRFGYQQLKMMLEECINVEEDFKRGKIEDQIGLELLLIRFSQNKIK